MESRFPLQCDPSVLRPYEPRWSPWRNGVAERWIESCRQDLLDDVIALNERHLKSLLFDYICYYHEDRTHLGLGKVTPTKRVCSAHIRNPSLYRCQPESQAAASTVLSWATLPNSIRTTVFYLCSEASLRFRRWMAFWRNTGTDIGYQLLLAHFNFGLLPYGVCGRHLPALEQRLWLKNGVT